MALDPEKNFDPITGEFKYAPQWQGPLSGRSFEQQTEDAINYLRGLISDITGGATPSDTPPRPAGTAFAGTSASYSRGDHVHPEQTTISGNAATASALQRARKIQLAGAVSGSAMFNGVQDITIKTTIPHSGVVNVMSYGAVGDGITDDTAAINTAVQDAVGKILFFPAGTYMTTTGLAIPSNTTVCGESMWSTIIKLSDIAAKNVVCVRNETNVWDHATPTDYVTDNTGNENIVLRDIAVDGNCWARASMTGNSGSAIQFAYVKNLYIENVRAFNGMLHCLDISSAQYADNDGPEDAGWYYGVSENVVIQNAICYDSMNDDALTTHWSHDVWIYNPTIFRTVALHSASSHGLEIDDGSFRIFVYGGHVSDYNCGLQIKGHSSNKFFPAHDVAVDGLVCDANKLNFWVTHSNDYKIIEGSAPIKNLGLYNCVSVAPTLPPKEAGASYYQNNTIADLYLSDVSGGIVQNFMVAGDGITNKGAFVVHFNGTTENVLFENLQIYDSVGSYALICVTDDTGRGLKFYNTVVRDCNAIPVWRMPSDNPSNWEIEIDGVDATRTAETGDNVDLITCAYTRTKPGQNCLTIRNVYDYSGYNRILGETIYSGGQYLTPHLDITQTKPCEAAFTNVKRIEWTRAKSSGGTSGTPTETVSLGYAMGGQDSGAGEGNTIGFHSKIREDAETEIAHIGSYKTSSVDTDTSHALIFGTRNNSDASSGSTTRWEIAPAGSFLPWETDLYDLGSATQKIRAAYIGDLSASSAIASGTPTNRSLAARFAEICNVRDFGALGDGVTDDSAAFAAAATAATGASVFVPPGNYLINSDVSGHFFFFGGGVVFSGTGTVSAVDAAMPISDAQIAALFPSEHS